MSTKSKAVLDVEILNDDDGWSLCDVCGCRIDEGDEFVWQPDPAIGPNIIVSAHPGCAVSNGYAIRREDD